MTMQTAADAFAEYQAHVIPKTAGPVQITESRRAFYAGAYFFLLNLCYNVGDEAASEDEGVSALERMKAELEAFGQAGGMPMPTPVPPPPPPPAGARERYTTPDAETMKPILRDLGARIAEDVPEGWGFNLLLFTFGSAGSLFYISNAEREDVIGVMREYIRRNEQ